MSQCWSDYVGKLLYAGEAKVTPVISALFGHLTPEGEKGVSEDIVCNSEGTNAQWDEVCERLVDAWGVEEGEESDLAALKRAVETRFGPIAAERFGALVMPEADAQLESLLELALLMPDGHNLRGVRVQGAWGADRMVDGSFGGWTEHYSEGVRVCVNSEWIRDLAERLEKVAASAVSAEDELDLFKSIDWLACGSLHDAGKQASFRKSLGQWLLSQSEGAAQ